MSTSPKEEESEPTFSLEITPPYSTENDVIDQPVPVPSPVIEEVEDEKKEASQDDEHLQVLKRVKQHTEAMKSELTKACAVILKKPEEYASILSIKESANRLKQMRILLEAVDSFVGLDIEHWDQTKSLLPSQKIAYLTPIVSKIVDMSM